MFACEHAGVTPDIMCISKGLTGEYMPMAITITTDKIFNAFYDDYNKGKAFMHSHTYSGNPLACSAAIEVLNILDDGTIFGQVAENAVYLNQEIVKAMGGHPNVGEIRHIGLINAIELVEHREEKRAFDPLARIGYKIYQSALKKGLLLRPLGDVLYFNPPLVISKEDIDKAVDICKAAINEILTEKV